MVSARRSRDDHAQRGVRRGRAARGRGDDDAGPLPVIRVTLFHAADCHLCERARAQLAALQAEEDFELEEVDITGVPELEKRYREWLPVVEIDGERAFTYFVHEDAFRRKVAQARRRAGTL